RSLALDPVSGGLWLGFLGVGGGGVELLEDGHIAASYGTAEGLAAGAVTDLRFGKDGALWVAAAGGVSRIKDGRVMTLSSREGLPCDAAHWTIEDDSGHLWLAMRCGLVRIARTDVERWERSAGGNGPRPAPIPNTVFDNSDGVRLRSYPGPFGPRAAKASDGRIWFFPTEGL